jgi:hypothetical protein
MDARKRVGWFSAIALAVTATARASTWHVDASYANCSQSDGSAAKPYCTIADALAVAAPGDVIEIAAGSYHESVDLTYDVTLVGASGSSATTIVGVGRAVWIAPGVDASLHGLTLTGSSNLDGGGVFLDDGTLEVADCVFDSCVTNNGLGTSKGGGLYAEDAVVTIERTLFRGCRSGAGTSGANTAGSGGAIYVKRTTISLVDCELAQSIATSGVGLYAMDDCDVALTDTSVHDGDPFGSGTGGGLALASSSAATLKGCTFTSNSVQSFGGAIWGDNNSTLTVEECRFEQNAGNAGGAIYTRFTTKAVRCAFLSNRGEPNGTTTSFGGAVNSSSFEATDCLFDSNRTNPAVAAGASHGGAAYLIGTATLTRCRFVGNQAGGVFQPPQGGALVLSGGTAKVLNDCEIVDNVASATSSGTAGNGGGIAAISGAATTLVRCTIAGNQASGPGNVTNGGRGGGLYLVSSSTPVTATHVIVAGNAASNSAGGPDVDGKLTTADWNCIGDTTKCTIAGSGPNDLLDVDPLFADPALGDFSLQPTSPCVESGDPALQLAGRDAGDSPRLLDGDLDGTMRLDRGAREFDHVRLEVTGSATPGGTVTVDTTGTPGLTLLMVVGFGESELSIDPFGALFIDLSLQVIVLDWGTIPNTTTETIDPAVTTPLAVWAQELANSGPVGNLSNVVHLVIE